MINGRESILNKIKEALKTKTESASAGISSETDIKKEIDAVTPGGYSGLWRQFRIELDAVSGEYISVKNLNEAAEIIAGYLKESEIDRIGISREEICDELAGKIKEKISSLKIISPDKINYEEKKKEYSVTDAAIVHALFAVADIGSLVFTYDKTGTSYPHFLCDNTFVIVNENQIVANQFELFDKIDFQESKNMVFITGPSRTADIEKVLVLGAHGPRRLVVLHLNKLNDDY